MGQTGSVCCCCGSDKRASEVLNDSLQEKLLDGEITHVTVDARGSSEQFHKSLKQSSTRNAGVATTEDADRYSEENAMRGSAAGRESSVNDDDLFDEEEERQQQQHQQQQNDSYTSHGWDQSSSRQDISDYSRVDFDDTSSGVSYSHQQHEISASDRSLMGARIADLSAKELPSLERDASVRSTRDDSYASSQEQESELAGEDDDQANDQDEDEKLDADHGDHRAKQDDLLAGALRRRSIARPSSSRVFDDEDDSSELRQSRLRGLTELSDHAEDSSSTLDGFGSFGSDSSLLQSFTMRGTEVSTASAKLSSLSFVESYDMASSEDASSAPPTDAQEDDQETTTEDAPPSPTHGSPRSKKNKKKTKKNRR